MNRRNLLLSGAVLLLTLSALGGNKSASLAVQATYTGSGTVDDSHKVYIALWDTPDFVKQASNARPIAVKSLNSKSAVAQFDDVQANPVYVSAAYDPTGKWDAASDPPSGTSLSLYGEGDTPKPIRLQSGSVVKVAIGLDDSYKKP